MLRTPQPQDQARILQSVFNDAGVKMGHQKLLDVVARLHGHKNWSVFSAAEASNTTQDKQAAAQPAEAAAEPAETYPDVLGWSVEDVQTIRPDLTARQAHHVLLVAEHCFDASVGLNWDILAVRADGEYPDRCVEGFFEIKDEGVSIPVLVNLSSGGLLERMTFTEWSQAKKKWALMWLLQSRAQATESATLKVQGREFEVTLEGRTLMDGDTDALLRLCNDMRAAGVLFTELKA